MTRRTMNNLPTTPFKQAYIPRKRRAGSAPVTSEHIAAERAAAPVTGVWTALPTTLVPSENHRRSLALAVPTTLVIPPYEAARNSPTATMSEASDTAETEEENVTPSSRRKAQVKTPRSGKVGRPKAEEAEGPLPQDQWETKKAKGKASILGQGMQANGNPHEVFDCEYQIAGGCRTEQFDLNDSRTCVSDYFGRNKAATARIKRPIRWCRKHYQRASFQRDTWQLNKVALILEQLDRIEEDDAGTTYTIGIKRSELQRLSDYNNAGKKNPVALKDLGHGEAPVSILQHIFDNYKGSNRTLQDCKSLINWVRAERDSGRIKNIPQFEMVPEWPVEDEDEQMTDADDADDDQDNSPTPSPKALRTPRTPSDRTPKRTSSTKTATPTKGRVSRISKSGAIQKP